jgi:mannan endo-1,4-beta-mannosidase
LFTGRTGTTQYPDNNDLDEIVNTFTKYQGVVLFAAHDWTGTYPFGADLVALLDWLRMLAVRYKNNPYVWFDAFNEPGPADHDRWVGVHQQIVLAIREDAGAMNPIVVEGADSGQEYGNLTPALEATNSAVLRWASEVTNFNGKVYPNIIFGLRVYNEWNAAGALGTYFDRVRAKGLAILADDYGTRGSCPSPPGTCTSTAIPAVQALFGYAVPNKVGRVVWHWYGGGNNLSTAGGGWQTTYDGSGRPTNLSACLGQAVWADNHGLTPVCQ